MERQVERNECVPGMDDVCPLEIDNRIPIGVTGRKLDGGHFLAIKMERQLRIESNRWQARFDFVALVLLNPLPHIDLCDNRSPLALKRGVPTGVIAMTMGVNDVSNRLA